MTSSIRPALPDPPKASRWPARAAALLLASLAGMGSAWAQAQDALPAPEAAARQDSNQASAAAPTAARTPFRIELIAPAPLDAWLLRHAELERLRTLPDLGETELERLLLTAPADLRQLLASQGYFSPRITIERTGSIDAKDANNSTGATAAPALVRIEVEPGPLAQVADWQILLSGPVLDDPAAAEQRAALQEDWKLTAGRVFTQQDWDDAKQAALRALSRLRYPEARITHSLADIDPDRHQAHLRLELDSGPAYRFGPLQVQGSERYQPETIQRLVRLAGVEPGLDYDERLLQAAQQRLLDSGDFESAFVRLDTSADPEAAPVQASVREAKQQKLVIGVGASTDSGARLSLEHLHRRVPGLDWRAATKLQLERDTRTLNGALDSPIDERGWRWNLAAQLQRQQDGPLVTSSQQLRAGRSQGGRQLERQLYAQYDRASTQDPALAVQDDAAASLSAHYGWTRRAFDDLYNPTRGQGLALELGAGLTLAQRQPYLRARARWQAYRPAFESSDRPSRWALRLEGGTVWSRDGDNVPATQRFLAGGEGSVRGYGLREIGVPRAQGGADPGLLLTIASLEWQRPVWIDGRRSDWETALFVDAGAVANHSRALSPQIGIGVGLRYRSPVGPLQVDLAYGVERQALRLHMSVGFAF
ncbi:outer membrane protein assembly factor [Malikia spinosa]|uniref:Outer membrane protein assembly factor n=1 Tax=Malikia spinosa TaxID=86180 RepID=A0A2S9KEW3_9BURK|nr:BamA/TamA family outer membrane protein [Malikia spinosa]PRD68915.1 outer membrane protein assembly factor [Malikia spinosa]